MKYWLHRISNEHELSSPLLLNKGILTIGFSDFTSQEFIANVANDGMKSIDVQCMKKWNSKPRSRYDLKRFFDFKKGDIVIVPTPKAFIVTKILDDAPVMTGEVFSDDLLTSRGETVKTDGTLLYNQNDERFDLGFARKVKVLHTKVSRAKFADAKFTKRMKIFNTSADISDLSESINSSIELYEKNKPINLYSDISAEVNDVVLSKIKSSLTPDKFEKLIKAYFKSICADDVTIPAKNERDKDGDADIIATFESLKLIIYVQAKLHSGETSKWAVEQVIDYKMNQDGIDDGYNKIAWVISTSNSFSQSAMDIAIDNEVQLINGKEFAQMIIDSGIDFLR